MKRPESAFKLAVTTKETAEFERLADPACEKEKTKTKQGSVQQ